MRKLLTFIIFTVLLYILIACDNGAHDGALCYREVKNAFPTAKIYISKESKFKFVVIDTMKCRIYRVETMSLNGPRITNIEVLNEIYYDIK